jgi:hypothetical protein
VKVRFRCPECEHPARLEVIGSGSWLCPRCHHVVTMARDLDQTLSSCIVCGHQHLYKKKNFPHWLGLTILLVACLTFLWAHGVYQPWVAWTILLVSAAFDGLFYLWVGDAIVCYRCGAEHIGFAAGPAHEPFELTVAERYRQERLRREQLRAGKKA